MPAIAQTVAPVFLLIVIGWGFKRSGFPGDGFWQPAERLAYFVLLPVLIVRNLAVADLDNFQIGGLGATVIGTSLIAAAVTFAMRPLIRTDGPAFTSFLQGNIRFNSYLAFAIAAAMFGPPGVVVCAVFAAFMMPTANTIIIAAMTALNRGAAPDWKRVPVEIATNPLILGCLIGATINGLDIPLPAWSVALMDIVAKAALPVALLCVGAGLDLSVGRTHRGLMALTSVIKLAAVPALAWALGGWLGLSGVTYAVAVMFAAMPASPAAYVLARQLDGDAPLMAGILTFQTLLAIVTVPLVLTWMAGAV